MSSRGGELRAAVETDLYYARFQEFGTSKMRPHPFMLPRLSSGSRSWGANWRSFSQTRWRGSCDDAPP